MTKIVFMGTPDFALPSLNALIKAGHDVICVVTQPDRSKGRQREVMAPPVKLCAQEYNTKILQPETITDVLVKSLQALSPELVVVVAYGKILPKQILDIPRLGCINAHASLLPKYRGAAPMQRALLNSEKQTGVTIMFMNERMDAGDILLQEKIMVSPSDNLETLHDRLSKLSAKLLVKAIAQIEQGTCSRITQNHAEATYAPMLKKSDGLIDWTRPAKEINNMIRAMNPWPGTYTFLNISGKKKMLKILKTEVYDKSAYSKEKTSVLLDILKNKGGLVGTGKGQLLLNEVQLESSRKVSFEEFIRGHPVKKGFRFR
ncbi:MAG: methionyl-tRNA formyltransferase [bacterium]|nr:methionyl-tRNA formyltransferase [bacterium]